MHGKEWGYGIKVYRKVHDKRIVERRGTYMSDTKVVENDYELSEVPMDKRRSFSSITTVSYTHLTLPTIRLV